MQFTETLNTFHMMKKIPRKPWGFQRGKGRGIQQFLVSEKLMYHHPYVVYVVQQEVHRCGW